MVRTVDYEARKKAILAAAITRYIDDAAPVSSEEVSRSFDLSPATIRNIFAELEESGYLTHPYTSGGRIPTRKGYRYYVDFLISQMELLDDEKECILKLYHDEIKDLELEYILDKTSEMISRITHYAGIASFLEWQDKFFYRGISLVLDQPEFQDFKKVRILIKMLEEKERLLGIINRDFVDDKVKVYIGEETGACEMENYSLVVSSYRIKDKPLGRLAVLGPLRMQYGHIIPVLEYISNTLTESLNRI